VIVPIDGVTAQNDPCCGPSSSCETEMDEITPALDTHLPSPTTEYSSVPMAIESQVESGTLTDQVVKQSKKSKGGDSHGVKRHVCTNELFELFYPPCITVFPSLYFSSRRAKVM
jgi:hypothetical protein